MLHLHAERLAALADDEPTLVEAEHLAACVLCANERAVHQRLVAAAASERRRLAPALTEWSSLSAALRADGVLSNAAADEHGVAALAAGESPRRHLPLRSIARVAAVLALMTGGIMAGRASAGASLLPASFLRPAATSVASSQDPAASSGYGSSAEALVALTSSQREYHRAAAFLAAHDTLGRDDDGQVRYRTRLAALDQLAETSREALSAAPADPVLNQYYLSTLSAREATIRQLGMSLPVGTRLTRF